jgi:hypothetical protein
MNHTNLVSGYDPEAGICWDFRNKGDGARPRCKCPACSNGYGKRQLALFGRCRSGARWFWAARIYVHEKEAFGWADSEAEAMTAAMAAVRGFRNGLPVKAILVQSEASYRLKKINKQKRAARPASNSKESRPDEYLYNWHGDQFRIIKKTKQRVYYNKSKLNNESAFAYLDYDADAIGFIARSRIKADCDVRDPDFRALYLNKPPGRPARELPDLQKLKRAMAAAHPDRGGSNAAFIAARKEYLAALREQRSLNRESRPSC